MISFLIFRSFKVRVICKLATHEIPLDVDPRFFARAYHSVSWVWQEIARLLMEKEKKEYRRNREREKEKEKERERLAMEKIAMERKRHEGNYMSSSEEVVRPRTRDEYDYQRQRNNNNRPARPPQPRTHDYENVSSVYGYSDHPAASRPPQRPEAAYRGAYQKR
ncbi:hypothetical protein ILYODFUR_013834 [Ilyodon furcidens]|uniref:Uncharacterized protein n=1 Tax=Ilyodon furcidens TaxID=33524 RepID=A0ABV0TX82_9TELE